MTETIANTPTDSPAGADYEISPPPGDVVSPPSGKPDRVTAVSNLALGSLLMALDALDGWVDRNVPTETQALDQRTKDAPQGALLPQSEWDATYGRPEIDRTRLAADGPGLDRQRTGRTGDAVRFADRRAGG